MADESEAGGRLDPAITRLVRGLAALLDEADLAEIEYAEGDRRVRLVRALGLVPAPAAQVVPNPPETDTAPVAAEPAGTVTAPMVGTVYLAPEPQASPFVKIGDHVGEGQTLLIIEAMKVMNHIAAPRAGRVSAVHVVDGMPVEYGQPLIRIE